MKITASGTVAENFTFSHESHGELFYYFDLLCKRNSGYIDRIPCVVSEALAFDVIEKENLLINGEIRTRNFTREDGKTGTQIYVFVKEVRPHFGKDINRACFTGVICKNGGMRQSPLGRQICDFIVAFDRENNAKSDYIPCIAWGRNSIRVGNMDVGTKVHVRGRLQSRLYEKRFEDGTSEIRTAFELSVSEIGRKRDNEW